MEYIDLDEAYYIVGGINITTTLLNSLKNSASLLFDIGRALGSSIRRISSNNICKIN